MLFINADDYGLSRGINNGILECAKYGIVNGISIVPNGYAFKDGIKKSGTSSGTGYLELVILPCTMEQE